MRNLFCDHSDLHHEADVEQIFARRLIEALGYEDKSIRPKASLEELTVGKIGEKRLYRPDFAMKAANHIRWLLEAKAPDEHLENHFDQANGYCEAINDSYSKLNPVRYFVLTNGIATHLYRFGENQPNLVLSFDDFQNDKPRYEELIELLRPEALSGGMRPTANSDTIQFAKPTIAEVNNVFAKCHQFIHQSDKISQAAGFEEFVKLITLKLLSDRKVRDEYPGLIAERQFVHPAAGVEFSLHWLSAHEVSTANPVDSILFKRFMDDVEKQIARKVRKRFFDVGEQIRLKPETIRGVVERLEGLYLFGIDADLNGRLFENFLSATMRGKDLGQYFTPRTLVKLGVGLGRLEPTDLILDGCCGTGGFLIDALSEMWRKVNSNASLSGRAKQQRRKTIAEEHIYGIDFAKSPNLAKIARLNMYLHGDGGSRIFNVDGLDREVRGEVSDSPEETTEKDELRKLGLAGKFDVVLTNPPFSKKYERSKSDDAWILDQYTTTSGKDSMLAKLMFFELYHHYLKPGGRLVSVIDDGFLTGDSYRWFREMLRRLYIIRAVVSLPGDAFQRSEARVKTSFIVLEKRSPKDVAEWDTQPAIFMYACRFVGIDDPKRRRWMPGDDQLRKDARKEVATVVEEYDRFLKGEGTQEFTVPNSRAKDRLDVKHCLIERDWRISNSLTALSDIVELKDIEKKDIVECKSHEGYVQLFTIKYDGTAEGNRVIFPRTQTEYAQLFRVRTDDIVISNIAASYGSVAVVPPELDGLVVSKEYTVLKANPGYEPLLVHALLRSPEIRAEMLLRTTGANRTRIRWHDINDIKFPYPDEDIAKEFLNHVKEAKQAREKAMHEEKAAAKELHEKVLINDARALAILDAFKPPQ